MTPWRYPVAIAGPRLPAISNCILQPHPDDYGGNANPAGVFFKSSDTKNPDSASLSEVAKETLS
jgi:hypothetical protein